MRPWQSQCWFTNVFESHPMLEFHIDAMTCGHCVGAVTRAIQQVDPQASVTIDLPTHQVRVESVAGKAAIVATLTEAGYEPA